MIPYQAVIQQLEKQLSGAKNAGNDQQSAKLLQQFEHYVMWC
ncbi:hypothetical protein AB9L15_18430 [Lysinibacillus fusiformis]